MHYWLISLMMYAFLRVLLGERPRPLLDPALFGSVLWTYSGYLTGYPMLQPSILEAIAWLPLMLLGVHFSLTRPWWRVRGILLASAMFALSFFGGHTQTTMQMTYLTAAYLVFEGWRRAMPWRGILARVVAFVGLGAALASVQLLPAYELVTRAFRTEDYHYLDKSVGFSFTELVQFVWPRLYDAQWWPLYLGVPGLLLALNVLLHPRKQHVFWIGVIVVGLWLSFGGNSIVYDLFYLVAPGFNFFRQQERAASMVVFSLVVLATGEIAALLRPGNTLTDTEGRRLRRLAAGHLVLTTSAFVVIALITELRGDDVKEITPNTFGLVALISLFFSGWLAWRTREQGALVTGAFLALIVVDLFTLGVNSPNFVPDVPEQRIQPPDYYDLLHQPVQDIQWHVDGAAGIQTYGTYWRIPDIYGTGPFNLATLEELRRIRVDRRWEVFAVRYATMIAEVPDNVPVRVVGTGVNYDGEEYTLYELENPRPFAHLVYQARVSEDGIEGAREIMLEPWIDLREIGVVTEPLPFELPGQRPPDATVRAFKMVQPEYMEMEVSTSTPALLTVALANYPGWEATVNGQHVDIVDTYAGLIGIPIPAGTGQKVTLRFFPRSVLIGGVISALALVTVVGYGGVEWWRSRRVARQPGRTRGGHA
ncbi:MAG: hypothetical protein KatS3mg051_0122 [Anaerolineae bacterium]|nr:MAG: hypothetical protein KatS3mg051_0122 [Anaerolineae bacterium]